MIAQLTGKVLEKQAEKIILDVSGVGYIVQLTTGSMTSQPQIGEQTTIYTALHVREDSWQLFGFATLEEKALFERLISISGIGPKLAMSILSSHSLDDFKKAVANEDAEFLASVPRLGSKNARRIILELKDKLVLGTDFSPHFKQAQEALKSLGYSSAEINQSLASCKSSNGSNDAEELVRQALRNLANG